MVRENQMDGCLPCQDVTPIHPQTRWRGKGPGTPPPDMAPPPPRWPPAPHCDNEGYQSSPIERVPLGYVYIPTPLRNALWLNLDPYATDCNHDTDFIPDLLTAEGTSTGYYTLCCVVMQLTTILQIRQAY